MGHIMVESMERARAALDALTVQEHGVDGKAIYLYGEAWDFGEVMGNQRGRNAAQLNIGGTGIGALAHASVSFCRCGSERSCSGLSAGTMQLREALPSLAVYREGEHRY